MSKILPTRRFSRATAKRPLSPPYDRATDLPRLIPMWPHELLDDSAQRQAAIVAMLRRALAQERQRGLGGHWSYDLARHARLLAAYRAEVARVRTTAPGGGPVPHSPERT